MFLLYHSCSDDDSVEKKTITVKYLILVYGDKDYNVGLNNDGLEKLDLYINKEMDAVAKVHDTEVWTITETAEIEEAPVAACDKKAIATFDAKLSAINAAATSVKAKFDFKKADFLSEITADKTTGYIIYKGYGGHLFKGAEDELFPSNVVKQGTLFDLRAVGGENKY